jgi:cholesterol transport system auxiliary component
MGPDAEARADLLLEVDALRLEQTFEGDSSKVRLSLRLTLTDLAAQRPLGVREYEIIERAAEASPEAGVRAANTALARFLEHLDADLMGMLRSATASCTDGR